MARYDVAVAALALDVPARWLDSVLARHDVPGVTRSVQGVRRTISDDAMLLLACARDLHLEGRVPVPVALEAAAALVRDGQWRTGTVTWSVALPTLRQELATAIADAIERAVPRRRGRPPGQTARDASRRPLERP